VVTRDVPPFSVVGGVPAKIIKRLRVSGSEFQVSSFKFQVSSSEFKKPDLSVSNDPVT
jgi:serine acetyltransferase